jgi:hypothetical protein
MGPRKPLHDMKSICLVDAKDQLGWKYGSEVKKLTIEFTSFPSIMGGVGVRRLRLQDLSLNAALLHRVVFIRHPQGSTPR